MTSQDKPTAILKILKEELPKCFKKGNEKIPLMDSIHLEVIEYYKDDKRFSRSAIRHAIRFYTSSQKYLCNLIEDTPRINLKGKPVGYVTFQEAQNARKLLFKIKRKKQRKVV